MLTNREIALAVWILVPLILLSLRGSMRSALFGVVKALAQPKVSLVILAYVGYLATWIYIAHILKAWQPSLTKDAVLWFFVGGMPLLFEYRGLTSKKGAARQAVMSTFAVGSIAAAILGIVSFRLIIELVIQPLIAIISICHVICTRDEKLHRLRVIFDVILIAISSTLIVISINRIYASWTDLDHRELLLSYAMTVWLPIVTLPFVLVFALIAGYEDLFLRLWFANRRKPIPRQVRIGTILGLGWHVRSINRMNGMWLTQLAATCDARSARAVARAFHDHEHSKLGQNGTMPNH